MSEKTEAWFRDGLIGRREKDFYEGFDSGYEAGLEKAARETSDEINRRINVQKPIRKNNLMTCPKCGGPIKNNQCEHCGPMPPKPRITR